MNRAFGSALLVACAAISLAAAEDMPQKPSVEDVQAMTPENQMERGQDFLKKIEADKAVKVLPSGLRIKVERPGSGTSPTAADTVKVHYRGTLIDGKEFDSSYKRDEPATFPLRGVIPCWTEGVQMLKPGGKATLYCPSEIAYGKNGMPPIIPGGATLVFEVELLEVIAAKARAEKKSPA